MSNDNKDYIDLREQAPHAEGQTPPTGGAVVTEKRRRLGGGAVIAIILSLVTMIGFITFVIVGRVVQSPGISSHFVSGTVNGEDVYDESFSINDVRNININLTITNIEVVEHNGNDVRVVFTPPSGNNYVRPVFEHNRNNGTLNIHQASHIQVFSFGFNTRSNLTIYLPRGAEFDNLDLRSTTGRINASNINAGNFISHTSTGNHNLSNITARDISVRSTTGRIDLDNSSSSQNITVSATTGNINVSRIEAANNLELSTTTGRIDATNAHASGNIEARASTGNINISGNSSATGSIYIRTTTGRIDANRLNTQSLSVQASTGNATISDTNVSGDAEIRTTTGRINFTNSSVEGRLQARASTGNITITNVDFDRNLADINNNSTSRVTIN
ncbi:MAG: DUF4097 domain-containing protein [Defluviitaleaceae bacterium]|nr:DUF4097 domain-containing protein [Defluviitaleaceae bacterium]